jgi:O-antigen/teichoic acid export membrane protein
MNKDIKSTIKHALVYSFSNVLAKAVGFIMLPVYANYLRGEGYGIIGMIDVVLSVIAVFIGYSIQTSMTRFYYQEKTQEDRNSLISTAVILMFCVVIIVSLPVLIFSDYVALLAFGKQGLGFYIILAVFTFIASMTQKSAETYVLIQQRSVFYAIISLSKLVVMLSLNIYFIVFLEMGVLGYLYSGLIAGIGYSLLFHIYVFSKVGIHFKKAIAKEIILFGLPLVPANIANFIRNGADRVLLRVFHGLTQVGAYEVLFKFASLIGILIVEPLSKIWGVKRFEIAEKENGATTMAQVFSLQLSLMMFVGLIIGVEIPILLEVLTPSEFWLGGTVAGLIVLSRIVLASYYHFMFGLLYSKLTKKISKIQILTMLLNVSVSFFLVQYYAITGAVISSLISSVFQCTMAHYMARKCYVVPFEWKKITLIVGMGIVLYILIDGLNLSDNYTYSQWVKNELTDYAKSFNSALNLDSFKEGKLANYIINNINLITEGMLKFLMCISYPLLLIITGVLPRTKIMLFIKRS